MLAYTIESKIEKKQASNNKQLIGEEIRVIAASKRKKVLAFFLT
jgi:hypothetical protein